MACEGIRERSAHTRASDACASGRVFNRHSDSRTGAIQGLWPGDHYDVKSRPGSAGLSGGCPEKSFRPVTRYRSAELLARNKSDATMLVASCWCGRYEQNHPSVYHSPSRSKDEVYLPGRLDCVHASSEALRLDAMRRGLCGPCVDERRALPGRRASPCERENRGSLRASYCSADMFSSLFLLGLCPNEGKARRLYAPCHRESTVEIRCPSAQGGGGALAEAGATGTIDFAPHCDESRFGGIAFHVQCNSVDSVDNAGISRAASVDNLL